MTVRLHTAGIDPPVPLDTDPWVPRWAWVVAGLVLGVVLVLIHEWVK